MAVDLQASQSRQAHLDRLLGFLDEDSGNLNLLADTAIAAFDAHLFQLCNELLARHEAIQPLTPSLVNVRGLSAMSEGRFEAALADFRALAEHDANPVLAYNLAYASAMCGSFEPAADMKPACLDEVPGAALLKLRALHHLGRFDEAVRMGAALADQVAPPPGFAGAYASLLFDLGDLANARRQAERAPDSADGLVIIGLTELEAGNLDRATELLERATDRNPLEARATLGRGLCLLAQERYQDAASTLDQAAERLDRHAGSWLAAGWAWFFGGHPDVASERFQHAAALDRGFAEAHGSLAVALHVQGRRDDARHHAEIALRLDPVSLSGTLARTLELEAANNIESANALKDAVLNRPLGTTGRTLAQSLTAFGLTRTHNPV
ncbi:Beta-barrel assembly-enhancing protease [Burkholderia lata]|uniref:Beta-barrel assembly-enhancing protease n=1 Tax=Burkholderia lata (strain ATCC 17760 / DSM 23089 / LMG 22485 / NCIMB 9086 / R18194 / 383) TaxID=482957 RepID=A0A6P2XT76_BURL3|nr:tetratricopeptide repeat protein [Burkholderia lata]VWD13191.1 Beta-barrel assembly-enhancing protease [Burkholderia lata]